MNDRDWLDRFVMAAERLAHAPLRSKEAQNAAFDIIETLQDYREERQLAET